MILLRPEDAWAPMATPSRFTQVSCYEGQNGGAAMGLMDRVKEQAAQLAERTAQVTQEAAQQGKAKLDQAQAKRRADAMFRDLGAAVYAERTERGGTDTADKIERLVAALSEQEAEQGLGDTDGPSPAQG